MRALLVNPWIHDFAAYDLWAKPLGLLKIASYFKRCGAEVSLVDCLDRNHPLLKKYLKGKLPRSSIYGCGHYYSEPIEKPRVFKSLPRRYKRYGLPKELFEELLRGQMPPDLILVTSGMTYWYPGVFEAIGILKERFGRTPLILGGIYARLCAEHARKNSGADFVYDGNNIFELLESSFRLAGRAFTIPEIKENNIFYAYELYPELEAVTLRASSGCPFRCGYCGWYLLEKDFVQIDPDFIVDRIEHFYKARGIKNFAFYDDALLYDAEGHALKIMAGLIKKKVGANFHTPSGLNIRYISPAVAKALKACGFILPRLGLESVSRGRAAQGGAKATKEEFLKAVGYLKRAGYLPEEIGVNIMMGLPGHDFKGVEESIRFVAGKRLRIHLEEYAPVPGTPDFFKSGLTSGADPLLHNNSAFPLYRPDDYQKFQELKSLAHEFNADFS
jgi:radical SAM superfamily enzyme YgiQ (UPF0313 family)